MDITDLVDIRTPRSRGQAIPRLGLRKRRSAVLLAWRPSDRQARGVEQSGVEQSGVDQSDVETDA